MKNILSALLMLSVVVFFGFVSWSRAKSDIDWHVGYVSELQDTGATYNLIRAVYIEKPWSWFHPVVDAISFFRITEMIGEKATFGVAAQVTRIDRKISHRIFYVYMDCEYNSVKEIEATEISDEEAENAILSAPITKYDNKKWHPRVPFVVTRRFFGEFCLGEQVYSNR